jgi:hypothetical protein
MDLLNQVWMDLNNPRLWKKQPDPTRSIYRDHYAEYRRLFSQTRAFNITNDALKVAFELSLDEPRKVAERLFMARLPFPRTWIEIDFHYKTNLAQKTNVAIGVDDETPGRVGWLLQEDPGDPLRWSSTTFISLDSERKPAWEPLREEMLTSTSFTCFMVDTANRAPPEKIGSILAIDDALLQKFVGVTDKDVPGINPIDPGMLPDHYWRDFRNIGWGYSGGVEGISRRQAMRTVASPAALNNSINIGLEPMVKQLTPVASSNIEHMIMNSAVESRGDVRLIVALLSLINEVPIETTTTRKEGSFISAGRPHKFLKNNLVRINIPARRPMKKIRAILNSKVTFHKARHEVRGHWRTIVHKKDHTRKVRNPDGSFEEIFFAKGQLERVWVNAHERGDASLGYVKHDYSVEKHGRSGKKISA